MQNIVNVYNKFSNFLLCLLSLHIVISMSMIIINNIVKQLSSDCWLFRLVCYTNELMINNKL